MSKLIKYINDPERNHEQGHVLGYGFATLALMPLGGITKWLYFLPYAALTAFVLYQELKVENWIQQWKDNPKHRPDLFYDIWTKLILAGGLAGFITFAVSPDRWFEHLYLLGISLLGLVVPYKFGFFKDRD